MNALDLHTVICFSVYGGGLQQVLRQRSNSPCYIYLRLLHPATFQWASNQDMQPRAMILSNRLCALSAGYSLL